MQFRLSPLPCTTVKQQHSTGGCSEGLGAFSFFSKQQHSDLGTCCTLIFFAVGCECIHLTRVHVHCCTGIMLIFAHCTDDTDERVMVQNRWK